MSILKNKFALINLLLVLTLIANSQFVQASQVTPPVTNCFIRVDNAHLSGSIKRNRGFDAVKVNANSICDKEILSLEITVEIYKKGFFRNHKVASKTLRVDRYIPANQRITHKGTWQRCISTKESRYYGMAHAVASIQGKKMRTLSVMTEKTITLPCGT